MPELNILPHSPHTLHSRLINFHVDLFVHVSRLIFLISLIMQVGNYIHNMATFFSGLIIGFINCWQIAAITLATGPFIVAAGGISNIFLHRLAENIQDAYAEAASIAEQVAYYFRITPPPRFVIPSYIH